MGGLVEGKVALVTGAASGIGNATAHALAREGARVVVADIDVAGGEKTAAAIAESGGRAHFVRANVTRESEVEALIAAAVETFGRLDCAVNNAGITPTPSALHDITLDDWIRTLTINLTGIFLCLKYELPVMQKQASGAIVNMASGAGVVATPGLAHYCASKHGILGLTKTAAMENIKAGIRVNALCPGAVDTPMLRASIGSDPNLEKMVLSSLPAGRLGKAEEIAEAAVSLCSERASFVNGESMLVDGGSVAR